MEEQALLLRENLLNLRRVLVTNRQKLQKVRYKRSIADREKIRFKKIKMREKMLETPKNINKSLKGANQRSAVKSASKSGLGNAFGLLAIYLIATNFDKIKKLVTDFLKGDTFKAIAETFTNIKNFFVGMFDSFNSTRELFGDKYREFIAFKDEKVEDFKKLAEKFKEIGEKFKELGQFAINLKKKFDEILTGRNIPIEQEKEGLEKYGFNDEDYNLEMQEDGNYKITPKNDTSNLGLTDYRNFARNNENMLEFDSNSVPISSANLENSSFDFSQYNDDEVKKEIVMIEKTNTVIVG